MRTLLFVTLVALMAAACNGRVEKVKAVPVQPQPDQSGSHPNPEQQGAAFSISTEVFYQATLPSTSSSGRVISLKLDPKGRAEMNTDYLNNTPAIVDTGAWKTLQNGNLHLRLARVGSKDTTALEFKTDGEKLVYTGNTYGAAGLTLWVRHLPGAN